MVKNKISTWVNSEKFAWAKEYVYGVDLDDRLVKTAKVSAFFNGDGEANIIWGNGLDNFEKSTEYIDKLKRTQTFDKKNNAQFDILISNPPYSVEAFKTTLKNGQETFELYNSLTDNSSEIECLFVERMKQLLKVGGFAGVVLPVSMLSNGGIHSKAREIIFKYFKIKSIVELGSGTFMKTGTNTVILFLERRADGDHKEIELAIDRFLNDKLDVTVVGIQKAFSKYVSNVYDDLTFDDYIKIIKGQETYHELFKDYQKEFGGNIEQIKQLEKQKILYFILTYNQEVVIVKTGKKQEEKQFLGYEFSERRGHEGLKWLPNGTKLYNENKLLDKTKANSYIYNAFNNNEIEIDESLKNNISYGRMSGFFEYGTSKFDKRVNLNKQAQITSKYIIKNFSTLFEDKIMSQGSGYTFPKNLQGNKNSEDIPFYKVSDMNTLGNEIEMNISNNYVNENVLIQEIKGKVFPKGAVIFPKVGEAIHTNKKRILLKNAVCDNNIGAVWSCDENVLINRYLFYFILQKVVLSNYASTANPPSLNNIGGIKIPLPPLDVQKKIVAEIEKVENEYKKLCSNIETAEKEKNNIVDECFNSYAMKRIGDYTVLAKRGKSAKYGNSNIQIIKSGQARGYQEFDFTEKYYVSENFVSDERNLIKEDLLVNSTGVGTAGRVTLFDLDGNYAVDSHITIIRLNKDELLPKFALYSLAHIGFNTIEQMATGQSGQIELSVDTIKEIKIPLPLLDKQKEIVAEIERYVAEISKAKTELSHIEQAKKDIMHMYLQ